MTMNISENIGPMQILVLEDEPLILMELALALEDEGAKPVTATNAKAALEAIASHDISAAILDVNLGRGSTCECVAERLAERQIPFLLHSGDLVRQGELIERIEAEVIPKPASSNRVAGRAVALAKEKKPA
ncbi:response regulator [Palleronia sp. LCG004]|uniref:response regulator n=1 Tax=Palleronia sp. LCG004 TaxID=3079304 RepID=UPI002941D644|nr:response regulator [Palleronia sp. LCG004]WOI57383.1 response regulator [Palleronia sp. LCG004]